MNEFEPRVHTEVVTPVQVPEASRPMTFELLIIACVLLIDAITHGFNSYNQWRSLSGIHDGQETSVQAATKVRSQLDALARETAVLADGGNPNAKIVVQELQKRGVTIDVNAKPFGTSNALAPSR